MSSDPKSPPFSGGSFSERDMDASVPYNRNTNNNNNNNGASGPPRRPVPAPHASNAILNPDKLKPNSSNNNRNHYKNANKLSFSDSVDAASGGYTTYSRDRSGQIAVAIPRSGVSSSTLMSASPVSSPMQQHQHMADNNTNNNNSKSPRFSNSNRNSKHAAPAMSYNTPHIDLHSGPIDLDGIGIELPDSIRLSTPPRRQRQEAAAALPPKLLVDMDPFQPFEALLLSHYLSNSNSDNNKNDNNNNNAEDVHQPYYRAWELGACEAARDNQPSVCMRGCCCCTMPFVLYHERRTLLFHSIEARYTCCAGAIPCCMPSYELRPELYMTYVAPPGGTASMAKYAVGEHPVGADGVCAAACATNRYNGLPQYGCYGPYKQEQQQQKLKPPKPSQEEEKRLQREAAAARRKKEKEEMQRYQHEMPGCNCACFQIICEESICSVECGWKRPLCAPSCACCSSDEDGCCAGSSGPLCSPPPSLTSCCLACPHCCLVTEVLCCMPCALLGSRLMVRQHYGLAADTVSDVPAACCYGCCLACITCDGSDPVKAARTHYPHTTAPPSCWRTFARSMAACCTAVWCMWPCAGCLLGQQRDMMERVGYPANSCFRPPDSAGMV